MLGRNIVKELAMKWPYANILVLLFAALCFNGFFNTFVTCDCHDGYTGQYCEADLGDGDSGTEAKAYENPPAASGNGNNHCVHGVSVYHKNCICQFGYTGEHCESRMTMTEGISGDKDSSDGDDISGSGAQSIGEEDDIIESGDGISTSTEDLDPTWSSTSMDWLPWEFLSKEMHSVPSDTPLTEEVILDDQFAIVSTGIDGTKTKLHVVRDLNVPDSDIYRFSFSPNQEGNKSRLELTTCFTRERDVIRRYKRIPPEVGKLMKISCPVSHLPINHVHVHEYEIFIAKEDFSKDGQYIITQWHGSADPTILRDQNRCIAQVSMKDINKLCSKGYCEQGEVFDRDSRFIGLNYNQGGYPPLTMTLKDGYFIIIARSDERFFIEKGGCSQAGKDSSRCPDHPRQQLHVLWKLPYEKFVFDEWVGFKWEVKWSKYDLAGGNYTNPGLLLSNAVIKVWMNGEKIVDWEGPCGRNDANRIPYFKIGVYNPSGSKSPLRFFMRRYRHNHLTSRNRGDIPKTDKKDAVFRKRANHAVNRNVLKSPKNYRFGLLSSSSQLQCVLHAERNYLAFLLAARYGKMFINGYTKQIISHLIYELENQKLKIESLENRLKSSEKLLKNDQTEKGKQSINDEL